MRQGVDLDTLRRNIVRLRAVIKLAESLERGDFPHPQSKEALIHVTELLRQGLERLESLSTKTDQIVINTACAAESRNVVALFPLLGFFLRSTDVRNAFELHGPFLRIIKNILGEDSKLVISSEWQYSPFSFIYPEEYKLTNTVMIGVPASESGSILSVPLSGHELGHNIWRHLDLKTRFGPSIEDVIKTEIRDNYWADFNRFANLGKPEDLDDLIGRQTWTHPYRWSLRQCEEMFCDFVGIAIFRDAFLHSFSYLLAPGSPQNRTEIYPSEKDRAHFQVQAANIMGVVTPTDHESLFEASTISGHDHYKVLLKVADAATSKLIEDLAKEAEKIVADAKVDPPSTEELEMIAKCFRLGVPPRETSGLPALVISAWNFYLSDMAEWKATYPSLFEVNGKELTMLSDLAFKSIEVFEIQSRQTD